MTVELSTVEFQSTFGKSMIDVTETAEPVIDIWHYVEELKNSGIVQKIVYDQRLVEKVYRSIENTYDQVLLPTQNKNTFIVILIDLLAKNIKGHYILDLEREYGLNKSHNT